MRVSLNWLKDYIDIDLSVDELSCIFTGLGIGVETIERPGADIRQVVAGKILSIEPHPDADKLVVCKTDVGRGEPLQIVCGAKNMKAGDIVPTALIGATLAGGFEIGRRKMRGIESQGMMCSARELGISDEHSGLLIMDPATPIGVDVKPALGLDDAVFDLEITPNRGDWANMIGIARELAACLGKSIRLPELQVEETEPAAEALSSVTIEDSDLCPRYIGRLVGDVKIGPSPEWMARRLIAAGQRPINNIVDITNYVMLETGQPLHAFDFDLLKENRLVVRTPHTGETITTIDGQVRPLTPEMLIIADGKDAVAVAGIMGGKDSEVGETSTRIFLESAWFNPVSIRRTARVLNLQTEASARFQRGVDPEMTLYAVNRAAMLMQEYGGGRIARGLLDEYPKPQIKPVIKLRYARTDALLGTSVPPQDQRRYMANLGFEVKEHTSDFCSMTAPSWRHDCTREADIIEEIARLYGYDNIPVALPALRPMDDEFAPKDKPLRVLRELLVGYGLTEFYNWTFTNSHDIRRSGMDESCQNMVILQNPLSEKQAGMRTSLIPGLLGNVSRNVRHGVQNILAFELGPVYLPVAGRDLPDEPLHAAIVLSGYREKHWSAPENALDLYDLKGYLEAILDFFGAEYTIEEIETGTFEPGQSGRVVMNGETLGAFGQVRANVLRDFDVEQPVFLLELDLEPLLARKPPVPQFVPVPAFPPSRRDLALLVDASVPAGSLREVAMSAGGNILKSIEIFDIYTGKQVPQGKKSIALSLVFQSEERTLTDADTQKTFDRILKKLQTEFNAEQR